MSQNITPVNAFTTPVVVPTDGDNITAASVKAAAQPLADQSYYLQQILQVSGLTMLRSGTLAAMQALTGMANGSIFLATGYGLYYYASASVATVDNFLVVSATGGGRWLHEENIAANASVGVAVIGTAGGAAGKLPAGIIPNGAFSLQSVTLGSNFTTANAGFIDVTSFSLSIAGCVAGDKIDVDAHWYIGASTGTGATRVVAVDGGTTTAITGMTLPTSAANTLTAPSAPLPYGTSSIYTVVNSGTLTIKGQAQITGDYTVAANSVIVATALHP